MAQSCVLEKSTLVAREAGEVRGRVHGGRRIVEESLELYTCKSNATDSELPDTGSKDTGKSYNELATLMAVTGEQQHRLACAS